MSEKDKTINEELDILRLIKSEKTRLNKIIKDFDKDTKSVYKKLIENAAFVSAHLDKLQENINLQGTMIEYQNGENQWGSKQNPDVTTYNAFLKQYKDIIKQMTDLMPKGANVDDELVDFLKRGKPR